MPLLHDRKQRRRSGTSSNCSRQKRTLTIQYCARSLMISKVQYSAIARTPALLIYLSLLRLDWVGVGINAEQEVLHAVELIREQETQNQAALETLGRACAVSLTIYDN